MSILDTVPAIFERFAAGFSESCGSHSIELLTIACVSSGFRKGTVGPISNIQGRNMLGNDPALIRRKVKDEDSHQPRLLLQSMGLKQTAFCIS